VHARLFTSRVGVSQKMGDRSLTSGVQSLLESLWIVIGRAHLLQPPTYFFMVLAGSFELKY
jgi:hypothetical protein